MEAEGVKDMRSTDAWSEMRQRKQIGKACDNR